MYSGLSAAIAAPPQRRLRPTLSCLQCRRRKIKCNQGRPCSQCERSKDLLCIYGSQFNNSISQNTPQTQENLRTLKRPRRHRASAEDLHIPTPDSSTFTFSAVPSPPYSGQIVCLETSLADSHVKLPKNSTIDDLQALNDGLPKESLLPRLVYSPDVESVVIPSDMISGVGKEERPSRFKMKLFGDTHWMNEMMQFDKVLPSFFNLEASKNPENKSELRVLFYECKKLGRAMKSERPLTWLTVPNFKNTIPLKEICDELVSNYLRTFESVYRIIHIPSFFTRYNEYWNDQEGDSKHCSPFIMQLLLILAIGSKFHLSSSENPSFRSAAQQWVYTAQQWLSGPFEKSHMNITSIQIQCLLLLAREAVGIGSDLLWISAGSLLRTAMQLGYHRDPKHYPGMSILHSEMRRRLWATIMEMGIKEALSTAMPPLISMNDFDTEPPANINDADINQETKNAPVSRDLTTLTQSSLQIILLKSLHSRLELSSITANFRPEISYEKVLRLHSEITSACREAQSLKTSGSYQSLTPFQCNYFDFILRRPLIFLHRPWAAKARSDPRYYFSRKVCLDTCLEILSFPSSADYLHLLTVGNGIWKEIGSLPYWTIALELMVQLEEEALNPPSAMQAARAKATREPIIEAVKYAIFLKTERLKVGEMNVKGHLFSSMALGQIEATERGQDIQQGIAEAAMSSLQKSHAILKERASVFSKTGVQIETSPGWDDQNYGHTGDAFDYESLLDAGLDLDMINSGVVGDWDDHSWL